MATISKFLADHPLPWRIRKGDAASVIDDANGTWIDGGLRQNFAAFVVELANATSGTLNAISRKDADLISTAHGAQIAIDELRAELTSTQEDAAELHDLVAVQRELIERLQNRIKRLEARA